MRCCTRCIFSNPDHRYSAVLLLINVNNLNHVHTYQMIYQFLQLPKVGKYEWRSTCLQTRIISLHIYSPLPRPFNKRARAPAHAHTHTHTLTLTLTIAQRSDSFLQTDITHYNVYSKTHRNRERLHAALNSSVNEGYYQNV